MSDEATKLALQSLTSRLHALEIRVGSKDLPMPVTYAIADLNRQLGGLKERVAEIGSRDDSDHVCDTDYLRREIIALAKTVHNRNHEEIVRYLQSLVAIAAL